MGQLSSESQPPTAPGPIPETFSEDTAKQAANAHDDVSRIIGTLIARVPLERDGKKVTREFIVGPLSFENWGTLQDVVLKEKRARLLAAVRSIKGTMPFAEYDQMMKDAMRQVSLMAGFDNDDAQYVLDDPHGRGTTAWILIESKYPGAVTREECIKAGNPVFSPVDAENLGVQVLGMMGYGSDAEDAKVGN